MTVKRSRICHSSSSVEMTAFPTPPHHPLPKIPAFRRPRKPGIFTIGTPEVDHVDRRFDDVSRRMGGFLEKCRFCCKNIAQDADIFMYSYLGAFCSEECRQKQIDIDQDLERIRVKPRAKRLNTNQGKACGF